MNLAEDQWSEPIRHSMQFIEMISVNEVHLFAGQGLYS